jgi:hypothetical protein
MDFAILVKSAETFDKIVGFVEGGNLIEALSAMGDTELEAAKLALENSSHSKDRKSEVWSAINHLQTAHFAY